MSASVLEHPVYYCQHCLRSAGSLRLTCIAVLLTSSNGVWIRLQSTFDFVFS